ncbi:MAG: glutamyl-tRNA reductase [Thermogutta sp.]|nr:MAG: glutamyl-tRNA reductase [Thermogutta sp.]
MHIRVVGCSHRTTPLEIREKLAFGLQEVPAVLRAWREQMGPTEAVLLSTCNRVELYLASDTYPLPPVGETIDFILGSRGQKQEEWERYFYSYDLEDAVRHLFRVAAGLDSMVLGEPQILNQVKQAYQMAVDHEMVGAIFHQTFQYALKAARRVASETSIQQRRVSIPSIAVAEFARAIFEHFEDKLTLVIGAGEMAEETLRYLREEGARRIIVINRHFERAQELAARWEGEARPWDELWNTLREADVVVSTTGSSQPIVKRESLAPVIATRPERPLFVLDLALPRDFEPSVGDIPGVYLYCLDDLQEVCQRNREARDRELPHAYAIVDQEVSALLSTLYRRAATPVIQQLRAEWDAVKEEELRRLWQKYPNLDPQLKADIEKSFDRLVAKLLHPPLASIHEHSHASSPHELLDALRKLFRLA